MPEIPLKGTPMMGYTGNPNNQYLSGAGYQSISGNTTANIGQTALAFQGIGAMTDALQNISGHWADKMQEADDYTSAQEAHRIAKTAFDTFHADLQNRTDYENFGKDYQQISQKVNQDIKPLLEKSSGKAREMIQQQIEDMSSGIGVITGTIQKQARVHNDRESLQSNINSFIDQNDLVNAKAAILKGKELGLWGQTETDQKLNYIGTRTECNGISRAIDSSIDPNELLQMADKLKAADENGVFTNFQKIPKEIRYDYLKSIAQKTGTLEKDIKDNVMAQFIQGNRPSDEQIKGLPASQDIKNQLLIMGRNYDDKVLRNKKEQQTEELQMAQEEAKKKHDAMYLNIKTIPWPESAAEKTSKYNKLFDSILTDDKIDDAQKNSLLSHLKTVYNEQSKPESLTNNLVYKTINQRIKDTYDAGINKSSGSPVKGAGFNVKTKDRSILYGDFFRNDEYATPEQGYSAFIRLSDAWENEARKNPNITPEQGNSWLNENMRNITDPMVISDLQNKYRPVTSNTGLSFANTMSSGNAPGKDQLPTRPKQSSNEDEHRKTRTDYITEIKKFKQPEIAPDGIGWDTWSRLDDASKEKIQARIKAGARPDELLKYMKGK